MLSLGEIGDPTQPVQKHRNPMLIMGEAVTAEHDSVPELSLGPQHFPLTIILYRYLQVQFSVAAHALAWPARFFRTHLLGKEICGSIRSLRVT